VAHLLAVNGSHEGKTFPIDPGLTIGREGHNTIAMPDNKKCSRDHAKVWRSGPSRFEVADVGSTNGTYVNDEKITRTALKDGDLVRIGEVEFRFEFDEAEKPKAPPSAAAAPPKERPSLADVLRGEAKPGGASAATGAAAIEIKQRILQYSKKDAKGGLLGEDVSQTAGFRRWILIGIALAVAAGLFFLVQTLVVSARRSAETPASTPTDETAPGR
jgi:pSer/pThr/pTyr-binding forkhead associated (FHA) protein